MKPISHLELYEIIEKDPESAFSRNSKINGAIIRVPMGVNEEGKKVVQKFQREFGGFRDVGFEINQDG